jgi:hypothetical protein
VSAQRTSILPDPGEWGYRPVYVEDVGGTVTAGASREIISDSLFLRLADGGERAYSASEIWRMDRQGDSLENRHAFASDPQVPHDRVMAVGLAGLMGAAVGFAGGAFLGHEAERKWYRCECDDPGLAGIASTR